jgi:ABC-type lipoprotein export system ATPase subunit
MFVIVVTHDPQALDVVDWVIEMEDGRIGTGHKPLLPA